MRIKIFFKIIIIALSCVLCGLFYIQIIRGNFYKDLSRKNRIRLITRESSRGNIFDMEGKVLADSSLSFSVSVIPQELTHKDKVFSLLAEILKVDKERLERRYRLGFTAPFAPAIIKDNLAKKTALILEDNQYKLAGVFVQGKPQRRYPSGEVLAHIIGYVREVDKSRITRLRDYGYKIKDNVGYGGIEEAQDIVLRAEKGGMQVEVDSRGRMVRLLGLCPSERGKDVRLTINLDM